MEPKCLGVSKAKIQKLDTFCTSMFHPWTAGENKSLNHGTGLQKKNKV